jgi:ribose/xylose/arabinose/galactoside ABC-type transport system permease subunit
MPQELGLIGVIVVLGWVLTSFGGQVQVRGVQVNNFLRVDNIVPSVLTPASWMAIMAIGVTFVVAAGGIDISVGSIFGLAALACAGVLQELPENASAWRAVPLAMGVALGVGLACGLINGLLVVGLRLHPFIVTLATMSIFRGIALVTVKEGSLPSGDASLPLAFTNHLMAWETPIGPGYAPWWCPRFLWDSLVQLPTSIQPIPLTVLVACLAVAWVFLGYTVWGREIYAIGGNEEAAHFSGLRVGRIKLRAYALSGLFAGIAAMVSTGYHGSANTKTGDGYELMVIAAAVVGGASLSGGRGTALGAVLGALVIQMIDNGILILKKIDLGILTLKLSKEYAKIIVGIAILVAVAVDQLSQYLQRRRLARRGG